MEVRLLKELLGEYTILGSAIAIILALLPLVKLVHYIISSNRTFRVQALDLIFKSYTDVSNLSHRLVVEQMFQSNFNMKMNYETILMFLALKNPTEAIFLYKASMKYLDVGSHEIRFKGKYQSQNWRKVEFFIKPFYNFILYLFFGTFGVMCALFVYKTFSFEGFFVIEYFIYNWVIWFLLMMFSFISIPFAISFLTDKASIVKAEALMSKFSNKTKEIKKWHY